MSSPPSVQALVVGAGPTGLVCAIALAKQGMQVAIVDSAPVNHNGSRAAVVHANTLEVLDTIDLAEPLIAGSIQCPGVSLRGGTNVLLQADFSELEGLTKFPYSLLIAQHEAERIFRKHLAAEGIQVLYNKTVVGLRQVTDASGIEVIFEDGSLTRAQYVVGADGGRSTIRQLVGIDFKDPYTGVAYDDASVPSSMHLMLADVYLETPIFEFIPWNRPSIFLDNFLLIIPLRSDKDTPSKPSPFCRIAISVRPADIPTLPKTPSLEYIQRQVDERNPFETRLKIASVTTASRYRIRVAVAATYFQKLGDGNILLAGDAAHVHSPAGGQGMNLGICDGVAAARAIQKHIETKDPEKKDTVLQDYSDTRRRIGIRVVKLTSGLATHMSSGTGWRRIVRNLFFKVVCILPFLRKAALWRLSGLVNRDGSQNIMHT